MQTRSNKAGAFRLVLGMSMDWLCFAVVMSMALYYATYLMLSFSGI